MRQIKVAIVWGFERRIVALSPNSATSRYAVAKDAKSSLSDNDITAILKSVIC